MKKILLFIAFFGYCCYGEEKKNDDKLERQMMGFGEQPNIGNTSCQRAGVQKKR